MAELRTFGPKPADHPTVGNPCYLCHTPFEAGDLTALLPMEPASEEDAEKKRQGRPYTARAEEIHASHIPELATLHTTRATPS